MKAKQDSPGVYLPPPLFYVSIFFLSIILQKFLPFSNVFFENALVHNYLPLLFLLIGAIFLFPALYTFFSSKNTLVTIKPATSLQTTGIYTFSRNPMYVALLFIYTGVAFIKGGWWTFLLIPLVIFVITQFVIIREEIYLGREFGAEYLTYRKKVRRWL